MNTKAFKYDFKLIKADPMLLMSVVAPFLLWILLFVVFPVVRNYVLNHWNYDLEIHYFQSAVFILPLTPMLLGMVYGFILLDERDEGILASISVTPLGKYGYLKLRLIYPTIFSYIIIIAMSYALRLNDLANHFEIIILALILSSIAPIMLLFLGAFASNKIEGIAISKAFGIILIAIVFDYILPHPYNWIASYSPLFWASKAYFAENLIDFITCSFIALVFNTIIFVLLWKKFNKRND